MNDNTSGQRNAQRRAREEPAVGASARNSNRSNQHEQQSARKPSKIEPREWRGSGVCGDRHTD